MGCARTRGSGWASRPPQGCWPGCPASPACPALTHLLPCGSHLAPRRPGVPHGLVASLPPGDPPLACCLSQPSASPWVCLFQHPSVRTCGPCGHGRGQGVHGRDGPPEELREPETVSTEPGRPGLAARVSAGLSCQAPSHRLPHPPIREGPWLGPPTCPFPPRGGHEAWSRETGGCSEPRVLGTPPLLVVLWSRAWPWRDWHLLSLYFICLLNIRGWGMPTASWTRT